MSPIAWVLSITLHIIILLLLGWGNLVNFFIPLPAPEIITVELLPINEFTNIQAKATKAKVEPEKEKPKSAKVAEEQVEKKEEEKKPDQNKKPELEYKEKKEKEKTKPKIEKKPEPEKKKAKKKKVDMSEFDTLLKSIDESAVTKKDDKDKKTSAEGQAHTLKDFDETIPLSVSLQDAIRSQLSRCWTVIAGGRHTNEMWVVLHIKLAQDGSVINTTVKKSNPRFVYDQFYDKFIESAIRAVNKCSPLKGLPAEQYNSWQELDFNFDPREMLY